MEEIAALSELKPNDVNKTIEVKIYRRWVARNIPANNPLGYSYMLLDRMGNAIQANASDMRYFNLVPDVDKAYKMKGFVCKATDVQQKTVDHPTTLKLGRVGTFKNIPADNFPAHYFKFITYDEVCTRATTKNQPGIKRESPPLTDYIGAIHNISNLKTVGSIHTTQKKLLIIEINNLSNDIIELKLWGDQATSFDMSHYESLTKPVIVAVSSCWVKDNNGKPQLVGSPATHWYLNPDIPKFHESIERYTAKYTADPIFSLTTTKFRNPEEEKHRNRRSLAFLLSQTPTLHKGREYTSICTILEVQDHHIWSYNACKTCRKKLDFLLTGLGCANHGEQEDNHSYCFKAYVTDGTAEAIFTFFETAGVKLIGKSSQSLIDEIEINERQYLPAIVKNVEGISCILQFEFGSTYPNKPHEFIANDAFDIPNKSNLTAESSYRMTTPTTSTPTKKEVQFEPETPAKELKRKKE